MKVDKIVKSRVSKWAWISDGTPYNWHYSYVALCEMGNDFVVVYKPKLLFARAYEFAYDEKMRAVTHFNEFADSMEIDCDHRYASNLVKGIVGDGEAIKTDRLVSLGYIERGDHYHPGFDNEGIAQLYIDEEKGETGANDAISIEPFEIIASPPTIKARAEPKYEDYEQTKLFI